MSGLTDAQVEEILQDHARLSGRVEDPQLAAVETAIFLEDAYDLVLTDDDIDPEVLGSVAGLRALVARRTGTG